MDENSPEDKEPAETGKERQISWKVINSPEEFRTLLANTISETVFQRASATNSAIRVLEIAGTKKASILDLAIQSSDDTVNLLRQIKKLLRRDPAEPIPLDEKYLSLKDPKYRFPIIALDLLEEQPDETEEKSL